jgi:hypothetical protein
MGKKKLAIAIPASVISDTPHLREKTQKIGLIGRAAAIFRVKEIIVYPDNPKANQDREVDLIATLLAYMETPQYLRKKLFKLEPRLQFAGILPPLRTPHHPLSTKPENLKVKDYREGVVSSKTEQGVLADIGIGQPALLRGKQFATGKRLTLRLTKLGEQVEAEEVDRDNVAAYWGFIVSPEKRSFAGLLENRKFDLTIATSKLDAKFAEVAEEMAVPWKSASTILLGFGAPTRGLPEIVKDEGKNLSDLVDFVVNTIPNQGTETVRTEEAVLATLAILNLQFYF